MVLPVPMPSFTDSLVVHEASLDQLVDAINAVNGFAFKPTDESVTSSTTLQNDDHLFYSIGAAGTYEFKLKLFVTSAANAAGDISVGFSFPTASLMTFGVHGLDTSLASGASGTMSGQSANPTSGSTFLSLGASTTQTFILIEGVLVATATGTLRLMWCQNSSSASATTVKAGSMMMVQQVA